MRQKSMTDGNLRGTICVRNPAARCGFLHIHAEAVCELSKLDPAGN